MPSISSHKRSDFIFVGLGNPGKQYEMTRHNIGFMMIDACAKELGQEFKEQKFCNSLVLKANWKGTAVHLLKPLTYMNLSGIAIKKYLAFYKLSTENLIVIVDDASLRLGQFRLREKGSAGGHNGLKSIELALGSNCYKRLRIGIDLPRDKIMADYVLEPFDEKEKLLLGDIFSQGKNILFRLLQENISKVMTETNVV